LSVRRILLIPLLFAAPVLFGAQATFDKVERTWTLSSDRITAIFQFTSDGYFLLRSVADPASGDQWNPLPGLPASPVVFTAGTDSFDASRQYTLLDQYSQSINTSGVRQYVVLRDLTGVAQITVMLEVYDGQPVLRYCTRYRNTGGVPVYVTAANMLPWSFGDMGKRYTAFVVNQWSTDTLPEDFEQSQTLLDTDGTAVAVQSGAGQKHCGWLALHDTDTRGLFAGWEFDGSAKTTVRQLGDAGALQFSSAVVDLNHPVAPSGTFDIPGAFIGLFHGDFDEAGYRTQRFMEAVLAKPLPATGAFPYVSWDSWGYTDQIDGQTLLQNADIAASIGVELFVVDLGWARSIGDWYADDSKFPDGLAAISNHVHSLGMKFGLHFALTEADPNSPVLQANPDWTSSEQDNYFGASSLCLSNQPTRDWLIQQAVRMIDDYSVDWILQDSPNVVSQCTKTTHTHDPADSNYSNAVDGLNYVVSGVQSARPNVLWENCESGGNMMTFNMVKSYVTSITNDASGALQSRRAVYGATYPFSPRYTERYMPDSDGLSDYATHSYRLGGPWVLMNQLGALNADRLGFLKGEIQNYKNGRANISTGKVFHILPPAESATDAIESYNADMDSATAVITRAQSQGTWYTFRPKGLNPAQQYTVSFEVHMQVYSMTGAQLMANGVRVPLPTPYSSDVVHIDRQ
jgi:alpha-galactosidase